MTKYFKSAFILLMLFFSSLSQTTKAQCSAKIDIGPDLQICLNSGVNISPSVSSAKPPYTYQWTIKDSIGTTNQTSPKIVITVARNTRVILKLTDSNNCVATDTMQIKVFPLPAVSWVSSRLRDRCYNEGNFLLDQYVKYPTPSMRKNGNYRIWGALSLKLVDSISPLVHEFNVKKINNAYQLQNGKSVTDKLTVWFRDSNGCVNSATSTTQIYGSPIIQLDTLELCQNTGCTSLDNAVVKPKVKFGTKQEWFVMSQPAGVNPLNVLDDRSSGAGTDWWMCYGGITQDFYAGSYKMRFRVTDILTTCYTDDTTLIKIIAEPKLTATSAEFCEKNSKNDLLDLFKTDGAKPTAAKSSFKILAFNSDTTSSKFGGAKIENGHYLSANTKPGTWTIRCGNAEPGCADTAEFDVVVNPKPVVDFTTTPADVTTKISPFFSVKNNSYITPASTLNYLWYFDTRNPNISNNTKEPQIVYDPKDSTYFVKLIAISDKGCTDSIIKKLVVGFGSIKVLLNLPEIAELKLNQKFILTNADYQLQSLWIFDMTGRLVFQTEENKGADLAPGNYTYLLQVKNSNGKSFVVKGKKMVE